MTQITIQELLETISLHTLSDAITDSSKLEIKLYLQSYDEDRVTVLKDEAKRVIDKITDLEDPTFRTIFEVIGYEGYKPSFLVDENSSRIVTTYIEYVTEFMSSRTEVADKIEEINSLDDNIKRSPFIGSNSRLSQKISELIKLPPMKNTLVMYNCLVYLEQIYENIRSVKSGDPINLRPTRRNARVTIEEHMKLLGNKGWDYAFRDKKDYDSYCELLTRFFEKKKYELPATVINIKPKKMTEIACRLGDIYQELFKNMQDAKEFYDIVRVLDAFASQSNEEIYIKLTKTTHYKKLKQSALASEL